MDRYRWLCHAYYLMDNHYHLLIETPEPNLSAGMRQLNGVYTQSFNKIYHRVGHLFQGRYKSILVEKETYLLELARYIVLNPVRANMVTHPRKYTWSSYKATSGLIKPPPYLSTTWILSHFGKRQTLAQKQQKYRNYVHEGITQEGPWQHLKAQCLLGSEQFIARLRRPLQKQQQIVEIPKQQRQVSRQTLDKLFGSKESLSKTKRNRIIYTAIHTHGYTQQEISKHLGLHYSTISRLMKAEMSK